MNGDDQNISVSLVLVPLKHSQNFSKDLHQRHFHQAQKSGLNMAQINISMSKFD